MRRGTGTPAGARCTGRVPYRRNALGLGVLLAVLAACSLASQPRGVALPAPAAAPVLTVTMHDYRFEYDAPVPAGRVVFRARNAGRVAHHLTMIPLPDDVASIDAQLRSSQRRFVRPFAGFSERAPGDTGTFAVDLVPGRRYAMICSVLDKNGEPHWRKGMASQFETTPARPPR